MFHFDVRPSLMSRLRLLLSTTTAVVLALGVLLPAAARAATPIPGLASDASLLFTLDAASGTLQRADGRLTLTLRGVAPLATWFTDRPHRNAGRITTPELMGAWNAFGFATVPPNAALTLQRAPRSRDTVALELRDPVYDARRDVLRFQVHPLDELGPDLARLNAQLDERIGRRFGQATLFIDNAAQYSGYSCVVGQPQLLATTGDVSDMLPADGRTLRVDRNIALASIYWDRISADQKTFTLPTLAAPAPGTRWYVCAAGRFPASDDLGTCRVGEVDLWISAMSWLREGDGTWLPADGRTLGPQRRRGWRDDVYRERQDTVTLPRLEAPAGMAWLMCVSSETPDWPFIGQIDLFADDPGGDWVPADGRTLRADRYTALDAVINGLGARRERFTVPDLPSPGQGLTYYISTGGVWPLER